MSPDREADVVALIPVAVALDWRRTLAALWGGPLDRCSVLGPDGGAFALRTPEGAAVLELRPGPGGAAGPREVLARGFGPGAAWVTGAAPAILGLDDDREAFAPTHPVLGPIARRHAGLRLPRTGLVLRELVPAILGQLVTWREASAAHRGLVSRYGEPAPGPHGLLLPPSAPTLAALPMSRFQEVGALGKAARTIKAVCAVAGRMEEAAAMGAEDALTRLQAMPGVGPWTAAAVVSITHGHADGVQVGDYHLPNLVAFGLAGEPRADDARMLELLAEFAPHRGGVPGLLHAAGVKAPSYGPKMEARGVF